MVENTGQKPKGRLRRSTLPPAQLSALETFSQAVFRDGAASEEIMEAVWIAAEMRAGAAVAHSRHALQTLTDAQS